MLYKPITNRRQSLRLMGAGVASLLLPRPVFAKGPDTALDFASIASRAADAGLIKPITAANALPSNDEKIYVLANIIEASLEKGFDSGQPGGLTSDSGMLLSRLNGALKSKVRKTAAPSFGSLKTIYRQQFEQCRPNAAELTQIKRWTEFLTKKRNRDQYTAVEQLTGVPWHVVATLHLREASANFLGHLHNGDPLRSLTVHVPRNRPPRPWPHEPWDPVSAWKASAQDALNMEGFSGKHPDSWTLEMTLFRFEKYNGFGYYFHHIPSTYLWNFSNVGRPGGYNSDGNWKRDYVSRQIGAAVVLKQMLSDGLINVQYES
ncbi:hypothetical protein [Phyllobacterium chamaecytisi]|uniref:hypothetical protein n=1 Tax=Phyllobacterium chamaecytisi TaxID=2876082 RepID=UPI001CCCA3C7|nr:hypothetical protein [Phyllobacterium sp. KW56]MBZ9602605.1 hypothetical protein [Phyllobacterium sp. KW56]